ncbi:hypothetical protein B0H12DRAFT_973264, partial [Mycena haematopus]
EAFTRHISRNAHVILVGRNRASAAAILACLPKASTPSLTHEFFPCDLSLIGAKRTAAAVAARFPQG